MHGFTNEGLHHGKKSRKAKDRDGQPMPANGGAAVSMKQCKGYSGSDGKGPPTTARKKGGGHMADKY